MRLISCNLDRTNSVNEYFIISPKRDLFLTGTTEKIPREGPILPFWKSQSEHTTLLILPSCRFSHKIISRIDCSSIPINFWSNPKNGLTKLSDLCKIKWRMIPAVVNAIYAITLKSLKKIREFNGIWIRDLAIPVRCPNQLSYEATAIGSWSIMCSYVPVKEMNVIDVYEYCVKLSTLASALFHYLGEDCTIAFQKWYSKKF